MQIILSRGYFSKTQVRLGKISKEYNLINKIFVVTQKVKVVETLNFKQ